MTTDRRRQPREYSQGEGLRPLIPLDLSEVTGVSSLVAAMGRTAFGGRAVGKAADLLYEMVLDRGMRVVLTLSGAMTVAKMGLVVVSMIEEGMVHAVVSTGALLCHGLVESAGMTHFEAPDSSDESLYRQGYNRVYDTLELEANLDAAQEILADCLQRYAASGEVLSSMSLNRHLGRYLAEANAGRAILSAAYERGIPVFVPAFTDSELGLELAVINRRRIRGGQEPFSFDPFLDLERYTDWIRDAERVGIFTVGGGVPRNWAQQVGPFLELLQHRVGEEAGELFRFHSGIRICPEPSYWGGLSGCTYAEGVSWGKFLPRSEGGQWVEVPCDATVAWPLVVCSVMERRRGERSVRIETVD